MAGFLSVEIVGKTRILEGLAVFQNAVSDLRAFWREEFAPRYFAQVQDLFALQGQPRGAGGLFASGPRWAPLSPRYAAWKAVHFPDKGILQRTERLRRSLTWTGAAPGPEGVFEAFPQYALVGTAVPYGVHHQKGTPNMPARPFLPIPDARGWGPLLKAWIVKEGKARGFPTSS